MITPRQQAAPPGLPLWFSALSLAELHQLACATPDEAAELLGVKDAGLGELGFINFIVQAAAAAYSYYQGGQKAERKVVAARKVQNAATEKRNAEVRQVLELRKQRDAAAPAAAPQTDNRINLTQRQKYIWGGLSLLAVLVYISTRKRNRK